MTGLRAPTNILNVKSLETLELVSSTAVRCVRIIPFLLIPYRVQFLSECLFTSFIQSFIMFVFISKWRTTLHGCPTHSFGIRVACHWNILSTLFKIAPCLNSFKNLLDSDTNFQNSLFSMINNKSKYITVDVCKADHTHTQI